MIINEENSHENWRQDVTGSIIHQVQKQLDRCKVVAGIGSVVSDITKFSHSYEEAIHALELVYQHGSASYMVYSSDLKQQRKELIPFEVEKELVKAVKKR
ncbi:hypothetical protein [Bacillus sp. JCM 19034]|uniref:hypothetical protein n=1 Tax=Bacillus sp. JCM 19034 TaxID=1481928 RepID=UPI000784CAEB|nr:hypothetical protein [Bacillus sp. JCM 19034]